MAFGQVTTVTARVSWTSDAPGGRASMAGVVVWLSPSGETPSSSPAPNSGYPRLVQKNKAFEPHVLVVPVGSVVEFPNHDPFFHNVFSLFDGKRFDLGLYEAGAVREVHFDKSGVSYIFCNIHPQMSAVVIAVPNSYYATSDAQGQLILPNVAPGRYTLHVWYEGAVPEELDRLGREVIVSERNSNLGVLHLKAPGPVQAHKNKYGRDYNPPTPSSPGYEQP